MNPDLSQLHPYPFEKLGRLFQGVTPPPELAHIALSIGEPQHPAPEIVQQALRDNSAALCRYPTTTGLPELNAAIRGWLERRFQLPPLAPGQVLPVSGTREALFAFAQAMIDRSRPAKVLMPNPFYQIYEGAALLAGGEPVYLPATDATGLQPDFDAVSADTWQQCQLLYLCSPGNPTGALLDIATLQKLIRFADEHNFIIASDECYSEIYTRSAPAGLMEACAAMGRTDYARCVVFHSLSKRSNLPGLRSGFVAGDATLLTQFTRYRTYHGCAMPIHHQLASIVAWNDETHVVENRRLYQQKFAAVLDILAGELEVEAPQAGFYLWPRTPGSDEEFARELKRTQNVTVLPGRYLSREVNGLNPGAGRVRLALVATVEQCTEGAERIRTFIRSQR